MALISLKDLLAHAQENKYAVGAFNITNLDFVDHVLASAVAENSPVIMQLAEVHFRYLNLEEIAPFLIGAAKKVNIPVCIHLDHGQSFETAIRAIRAGFTSVMFDGSKYPLEENIARTREVVKIAHSVGVSVEGEIGYVGGEAVGIQAAVAHSPDEKFFTNVDEAKRFAEESELDALAIAIGNVHGLYKGDPKLDFDRLQEIRNQVDIPLVLHGGSGISDDSFRKAVSLGICKINFYTGMTQVAVQKVHDFIKENPKSISYPDLARVAMEELEKTVKERLRVFGSAGMCAANKSLCITCSETSCGLEDPRMKPEARTVLYNDLVEKISLEVIQKLKR